ncbi:MAG TPA: STAS domain-containing protein [Zoogloea sp.]|uniref:STAS domain-containing protein n=1 Tax=Zoogloea sp. TaxID=49181 RepID=UPI002BC0F6B6|nr:STAS domain-containing protein [Zoogloea sp.]HMV18117.1 STAS domain-containing protein [Rhodocyclaceae bacterium]HMV64058.1 STAS domain-containing protein [Rhodocyclaceae bacterium]HMW52507.1 STAS domain-containing protein [Rhodocyclaceae bacterium]HMY50390.1 STAS domain-containing protein [Rhodocyclaceae bacterium]HMZ76465.1 STAS domain-containing protein [Rhodocyclaceae bacterium]
MVLPFFGKKPPPAGSSTPRSSARSPSGSSAAAARPGLPQPDRNETSSLDFTIAGGDIKRVLAQCADRVHVEEGVDEMSPPAEEAAILYANGAWNEARSVLEHALQTTGSSDARLGVWVMLLDLLRLTGQREQFDALSLAFATEFERSPPAWQDLSSQSARPMASKTPLVNLSGALSGQAAAQFAQLIQVGMRSGALRIDLTRLRSIDQAGAELLLRAVRGLRKARIRLSLVGAPHLVNLVSGQVVRGRADNKTQWLLLLEALQYTDQQERFEELAVDYAMTFEESPPSWEPPMVTESQTEAVEAVGMNDIFVLEGEVVGPNAEALRKLAAFANDRNKIEVDCGRLRRMDFVSAGNLFNIVSQLHSKGRLVVLKSVNSMVAALMQVMSLHEVARIELRG